MAQTILELQLKGVNNARQEMDRLSLSIEEQKKKQRELKKEIKELEKALDGESQASEETIKALADRNLQLEASKKQTQENRNQLKQNIRVYKAQEGSLDQLRASLNLLQKEYGQLNKETDEGAREAAHMAEQIERLNLEVKSQEKAIGDTRRNVGNYEEAIQSAIGSMMPFGNQFQTIVTNVTNYNTQINQATQNTTNVANVAPQATSAFKSIGSSIAGATKAALAFIMTPIGAAIAALAAIGAATKAFMDYNEEAEKTNALIAGITNQSGEFVDQIRIQSDAIAQTLGVDQEQLVNSAKVLVQQFGISYEEALTKIQDGLLATNGANDEFLQSIGEYSTFFSDAGYSVEEFANIVNAGFDLGIYADKLPDALKEADISLREQTKATREALTNAFGEDFTTDILNQINTGAMSTKEALELMSQEAENVGLSAEQAATLTADVFRGAGEDAGGALKVFDAINVSLAEQTSELDEQGRKMQEDIARQQKVAEARDRALNSKGVKIFSKAMKDLGAFLSKFFYGAIELVGDGISAVQEALSALSNAASSAMQPLRDIASALGFGNDETERAVESSSELSDKLDEQAKAAAEAAAAQRKLEAETAAAEAAMKQAKERADEYVGSLRDIVAEQARKPFLTEAEDIFSTMSEEAVINSINSVADAFEENSNRIGVDLYGVTLSQEEFAKLAQDRLNELERGEKKRSSSRSSRRSKEDQEAKQEKQKALDRLKTLQELVNAEVERNMTEEELLTKRLNDKLRELELDKDITTMTEQELAARTALYDKYNDDIQALQDKRADKLEELTLTEEEQIDKRFYDKLRELDLDKDITEMTAAELEARAELYEKYNDDLQDLRDKNTADALKQVEDDFKMQMLVAETAHLNELRNKELTDEQLLQLEKDFQAESLQLQKDALIKQIELIESTLGDGETTAALEQLRNALAGINLEIQNAGKDEEGEPKPLAERLGLEPEQVERITMGIQGVEAGLDTMSQLVEARAQERFGKVDQLLQQGVINEEEAERRKEQIKKDAARKQQKIDITQAVINTAKAVTSALNTQPFLPAGLIMAGIATAQGAAQIKMIRSQKFAKGGILNGPSHAQGGIPMFSKGGAFYGEAEGGEAVLTKGVMANPALASMASAINVAGGGVPFFANGGVLEPIQSATPTDRAADIIASGLKSRQPVLVVEQLRERENSVDVIESLRTIG